MEERDRTLIDHAVAQGILSPEQHRRLTALADGSPLVTPDERFRVVNGFSEVFISVGLIMLLGALSGLLQLGTHSPATGLIITAGTAWFLAYFFTSKKRALLPAILCCLYASCDIGEALLYV